MPRQTQMTKEVPAEDAPSGASPTAATPARETPVRDTPARTALKEVERAPGKTDGDAGESPADGEALETLEAMMKANEAMLQGMATMQREIMDFGNARLRHEAHDRIRTATIVGSRRDHCRAGTESLQSGL